MDDYTLGAKSLLGLQARTHRYFSLLAASEENMQHRPISSRTTLPGSIYISMQPQQMLLVGCGSSVRSSDRASKGWVLLSQRISLRKMTLFQVKQIVYSTTSRALKPTL